MKDLRYFWKISRPLNIGITALSLSLSAYLATHQHFYFLSDYHFWAALVGTLAITMAGYWINDVYDYKIDRINKPERAVVNTFLSVKKVLSYYFGLHFLLFPIAVALLKYEIVFLFFLAACLLFLYAAWLKRVSVAGNLLVAFLTALVLILGGYLYGFTKPLGWAIIFAFQITLIREMVKDIEDIEGDLTYKLHTLPIQLGVQKTKQVLYTLLVFFFISVSLPLFQDYLYMEMVNLPYLICSLVLVQLPALYLFRQLIKAEKTSDYAYLSSFLKWMILSGMISVLFL